MTDELDDTMDLETIDFVLEGIRQSIYILQGEYNDRLTLTDFQMGAQHALKDVLDNIEGFRETVIYES